MKKVSKLLALLLVLVMSVSLVACGGSNEKTTNILPDDAGIFDFKDYKENVNTGNQVRDEESKKSYIGKVYKFFGFVDSINSNNVIIRDAVEHESYNQALVTIALSKNDIMKVSNHEFISVIGEVTKVDSNGSLILGNAKYLTNEHTFSFNYQGEDEHLISTNGLKGVIVHDESGAIWSCYVEFSPYLENVPHIDGKRHVSGVLFGDNYDYHYLEHGSTHTTRFDTHMINPTFTPAF